MISSTSRYQLTAVVEVRDSVTGEVARPSFVDIRPRVQSFDPTDRAVVSTSARHWAHMGLRELLDANHWWIIADLSGVIDPFTELTDSKTLRVPSVERFLFDILTSPGEV